MPQIEIPFTPGQRVRTKEGAKFEIDRVRYIYGAWEVGGVTASFEWYDTDDLTLVEPVIEWERKAADDGWFGFVDSRPRWEALDDGALVSGNANIGTFPDPRAVAEATQKLWNEARKG